MVTLPITTNIGIGPTGCTTIAHLRHMLQGTYAESTLASVSFLGIGGKEAETLGEGAFVKLPQDPIPVAWKEGDPVYEWYPRGSRHIPERARERLKLFHDLDNQRTIPKRLRKLLEEIRRQGNNELVTVNVIVAMDEPTASGILIDILHMIRQATLSFATPIRMALMVYLIIADDRKPPYDHSGGQAALRELARLAEAVNENSPYVMLYPGREHAESFYEHSPLSGVLADRIYCFQRSLTNAARLASILLSRMDVSLTGRELSDWANLSQEQRIKVDPLNTWLISTVQAETMIMPAEAIAAQWRRRLLCESLEFILSEENQPAISLDALIHLRLLSGPNANKESALWAWMSSLYQQYGRVETTIPTLLRQQMLQASVEEWDRLLFARPPEMMLGSTVARVRTSHLELSPAASHMWATKDKFRQRDSGLHQACNDSLSQGAVLERNIILMNGTSAYENLLAQAVEEQKSYCRVIVDSLVEYISKSDQRRLLMVGYAALSKIYPMLVGPIAALENQLKHNSLTPNRLKEAFTSYKNKESNLKNALKAELFTSNVELRALQEDYTDAANRYFDLIRRKLIIEHLLQALRSSHDYLMSTLQKFHAWITTLRDLLSAVDADAPDLSDPFGIYAVPREYLGSLINTGYETETRSRGTAETLSNLFQWTIKHTNDNQTWLKMRYEQHDIPDPAEYPDVPATQRFWPLIDAVDAIFHMTAENLDLLTYFKSEDTNKLLARLLKAEQLLLDITTQGKSFARALLSTRAFGENEKNTLVEMLVEKLEAHRFTNDETAIARVESPDQRRLSYVIIRDRINALSSVPAISAAFHQGNALQASIFSAERNASTFEQELGRRLHPLAVHLLEPLNHLDTLVLCDVTGLLSYEHTPTGDYVVELRGENGNDSIFTARVKREDGPIVTTLKYLATADSTRFSRQWLFGHNQKPIDVSALRAYAERTLHDLCQGWAGNIEEELREYLYPYLNIVAKSRVEGEMRLLLAEITLLQLGIDRFEQLPRSDSPLANDVQDIAVLLLKARRNRRNDDADKLTRLIH